MTIRYLLLWLVGMMGLLVACQPQQAEQTAVLAMPTVLPTAIPTEVAAQIVTPMMVETAVLPPTATPPPLLYDKPLLVEFFSVY